MDEWTDGWMSGRRGARGLEELRVQTHTPLRVRGGRSEAPLPAETWDLGKRPRGWRRNQAGAQGSGLRATVLLGLVLRQRGWSGGGCGFRPSSRFSWLTQDPPRAQPGSSFTSTGPGCQRRGMGLE